jgi:hypothetical protein
MVFKQFFIPKFTGATTFKIFGNVIFLMFMTSLKSYETFEPSAPSGRFKKALSLKL